MNSLTSRRFAILLAAIGRFVSSAADLASYPMAVALGVATFLLLAMIGRGEQLERRKQVAIASVATIAVVLALLLLLTGGGLVAVSRCSAGPQRSR